MRISIEKKQEEKISKLQHESANSRKKIKSLENKLATGERKRQRLMEDHKKKPLLRKHYSFADKTA